MQERRTRAQSVYFSKLHSATLPISYSRYLPYISTLRDPFLFSAVLFRTILQARRPHYMTADHTAPGDALRWSQMKFLAVSGDSSFEDETFAMEIQATFSPLAQTVPFLTKPLPLAQTLTFASPDARYTGLLQV